MMPKAYCLTHDHYPSEVLIRPVVKFIGDGPWWGTQIHPDNRKPTEIAVVCDRYGYSTGVWEDGTVGVPAHIADACADEEDYIVCREHGTEIEWRDGKRPDWFTLLVWLCIFAWALVVFMGVMWGLVLMVGLA